MIPRLQGVTLAERLLNDLGLMASQGETPDGDGITVNVQLWAEQWIARLRAEADDTLSGEAVMHLEVGDDPRDWGVSPTTNLKNLAPGWYSLYTAPQASQPELPKSLEIGSKSVERTPRAWKKQRPYVEGAYWVKDKKTPCWRALVEVRVVRGELRCNAHEVNSENDYKNWRLMRQLPARLYWCGPLEAGSA